MTKELNYDFNLAIKTAFVHAVDPASAYEQLRWKLIKIFVSNGHSSDAEHLTDKVMDRVLAKVSDGSVHIEDNKSVSNYALGVARYVILEQRRSKNGKQSEVSRRSYLAAFQQEDSCELERRSRALDKCLDRLKPDERKLLIEYYGKRSRETKRLADELGISHQALRVRALRIRNRLKEMMDQYLDS